MRPMRSLRTGFVEQAVGSAVAEELAADLGRRYAEPHRRYHTIEHITEMEDVTDALLGQVALSDERANAVRLAVWFHDAIYDPAAAAGANENASAQLAADVLQSAGMGDSTVTEVARLIRLTAGHEVDRSDDAGAVLADADLAILAMSPGRYDRYVRDVRAEYAAVDDTAWRLGRTELLRRFLDAAPLYRTGADREQREQAAKANLGRELASLTDSSAGPARPTAGDAAPRPAGDAQAPEG
jgi:predicted metal-dependent HD superfamily phosphohydrolase